MTGLRGSLRAPHSFYCSCQSSEIPSGPLALSVMLFLSQYTALSVVMLITTSNRPTNDCSLTGALDRFYSRLSAPTTDCLFIVCLPMRPVKKMGYRASLGTLALLLFKSGAVVNSGRKLSTTRPFFIRCLSMGPKTNSSAPLSPLLFF